MATHFLNMKITYLLLTFLTIVSITGCKEPGCIDPNAVNYDAEADSNDGSCVYERDKFIGTYEMYQECEADDYPSKTIEIVTGGAMDEVKINGWFDGFSITAKVDGNEIFFEQEYEVYTYAGIGYIAGSAVTIDYNVCLTVDFPCDNATDCTMICFN